MKQPNNRHPDATAKSIAVRSESVGRVSLPISSKPEKSDGPSNKLQSTLTKNSAAEPSSIKGPKAKSAEKSAFFNSCHVPRRQLPPDDAIVNVSWASSDGHFYVIVNEDMRRLNEFVRDMTNYYQQSRRSGIHSRSYHYGAAKEGNLGVCLAFYQRDMAQVKGKILTLVKF